MGAGSFPPQGTSDLRVDSWKMVAVARLDRVENGIGGVDPQTVQG